MAPGPKLIKARLASGRAKRFEWRRPNRKTAFMNLKQLSAHLGLSQTTVSRALNGFPEVGAATRLRVAEAAKKHDYRPNPSARKLATGRAEAVGFIFPTDRNLLVDPHFVEFLAGLGEELKAHEMDILLSPAPSADEASAYRRAVNGRRVDGLIVSGPFLDDARIRLLEQLGANYVVHGRSEMGIAHAWLDIDNIQAFRQATSHLLDLGHRRIALVNGREVQTFASHRKRGYLAALEQRGVRFDPALVTSGEMTDKNGFGATARLLDAGDPPTAIICSSMLSVLGCMRAIRAAGLAIGADVSLIAHDDGLPFINPAAMMPALTTTRSPIRDAGRCIADLIVRRIAGEPVEALQELWPVELVVRGSTRPPPE